MALALLGLVFLVGGAEIMVRGASALAQRVGISSLVVGLTVVAFGTSAPELAVSLQGALTGQTDMALGNVIGSNIFNILIIVGLSAMVVPLVVAQQLVRQEIPLMIGASLLILLLAIDGRIGRIDGALLFVGVVIYTAFVIRQSRKTRPEVVAEYEAEFGAAPEEGEEAPGGHVALEVVMLVGGLGLLILGSRWFVGGAVALARALEVEELIISLTVVAAGTSLPELATSVVAAVRGERDIAVGNAVGSNLFNLLCVLGLTAVIAPTGVPVSSGVLGFDLPVMLAVAVACLPVFFSGYLIDRWEGAIFVIYYVAYTVYLVLSATEHAALAPFGAAFWFFVMPITALTLAVIFARAWRARRDDRAAEG